ncbi:hypothetical protein D7Y27_21215 [Corallococcus sp. AB004]|uniref:hypothetical protein n=1 Tax=Corallococcus exiguus TaxID=83462 RepID=UPI000EA04549|nr:hypothetical protein [Corallococcus exiguus]NPD24275.1 hypothetical protein [Corallococcus exiguus]RKI39892.1 hypothetical protein D7Y27_21215 [Corallococcus sp. AB004]
MSQQALRSEPLPSSVDEAPADAPESISEESFPPLTFLLEEVRSPGMVRADIDALIVGLGRPPAPDEVPRERADLLLGLLDRSNPVGDYAGSGGMKVRHAAKEALIAMGYPYAMELPPELVEAKGADNRAEGLTAGNATLAVASALYQSAAMVTVWFLLEYFRMPAAAEVTFGIGSVLWIFTVLSLMGHHSRSRDMQSIASVVLWAAAVLWILVALPLAVFTYGVALIFIPWHLALWTAISLRPEAEEEAPTKRAPSP